MTTVLALKALREELTEPDWSANLEICDEINSGSLDHSIFDVIQDRLLSPGGEYLALVLLDTVVKNCRVDVLGTIPEQVVHSVMKIADKGEKSPHDSEYAFEILYDWYKSFEISRGVFPSLFAQERELEHCFFLRFKDNIRPEFLHAAALKLENDLAKVAGVAQDASSIAEPTAVKDMCCYFRCVLSRLQPLIEGGALDGLAEDLFARVLRVHDEVSDAMQAAQVQLWLTEDHSTANMSASTTESTPRSSHKRTRDGSAAVSPVSCDESVDSDTASSCGYVYRLYLECTVGSSDKFYELQLEGSEVRISYGRRGSQGVHSVKSFSSVGEARDFIEVTAESKRKKGYVDALDANVDATHGISSTQQYGSVDQAKNYVESMAAHKQKKGYRIGSDDDIESSSGDSTGCTPVLSSPPVGHVPAITSSASAAVNATDDEDDLSKLERGEKVFVKGSSALPYTMKKFNGGYSCTCPGWKFQIKNKGIQSTSCKHLRELRGNHEEDKRCASAAGGTPNGRTVTSSSSGNRGSASGGAKNLAIPRKISLANKWSGGIDLTLFAVSEKLDGMRAYWDGRGLWSRSGLPVITPDWFVKHLPADLELDGELFMGRQMFAETMTVTRRSDGGGDWHRITYVVFDAPTVAGGILDRIKAAKTALAASGVTHAHVHPHEVCRGEEHLMVELARVEALGGEGLMLRKLHAAHRAGRSSDLLKVKTFHDDEAMITDYEAGKGKYNGMVGALVCVLRNGCRFKVGSGLSDSQRSYSTAPKIGTIITFKYFELTPDGVPRFPTFLRVRPDVSCNEFP